LKAKEVYSQIDKLHETASKAQYIVASHHSLESWGDGSPITGAYTFMQPTISPLFETRQWQDCLLTWTRNEINYKDYVKNAWTSQGFDINDLLHDGFLAQSSESTISFNFDQLDEMASKVSSERKGLELVFYKKAGIGIGELSNNPWLQEFPDPISRASWDNYLTISASQAVELGLINKNLSNGALNGSRVNLKTPAGTLENVPVLIQPGQEYGTLGLAVGYGRKGVGKVGDDVVNGVQLVEINPQSTLIRFDGELIEIPALYDWKG
jgi:molybdopterin-containing oxidoreductase family iron-sulfur binding subunit